MLRAFIVAAFAVMLSASGAFAAQDQLITWTDTNSNEDGYRVELEDSANPGTYAVIATLPADSTSYTNSCTQSTCCYRVAAFSAGLPDAFSAKVCRAVDPLANPVLTSVANQ